MLNFRFIIVFLTILGMEISWLYALLNASNKSVADQLSIPLLMGTILVSLGVSKGLRYLRWPKLALTTLSWLIWIIVLLLMIKIQLFPMTDIRDTVWLGAIPQAFSHIFIQFEPALLILTGSAVLWWFGRHLAYSKADFPSTVTEFQFGLGILIITFFSAYMLELDQSSSIPVSLSFFTLALSGISISHAREDNSWLNSWKQGHWTGMLLVSIGIIILLGILISAIVTPDFLKLIVRFLGWIWGLVEAALRFIASLLPQDQGGEVPPMPTIPSGPGPDESIGFSFPEWLMQGMRLGWSLLAAGVVLFAIYRITSQIFAWMRRRAMNSGAEVESLKGAFKLDLLNWIKKILSKLLGIKFGQPARARTINLAPETATVRQLYSQLLRWAADRGFPRHKSQTPHEYQYVLSNIIPENQEDLDFITSEYMSARYGPALPTESELSQLKQRWHELKKTELKRHNKKKT